MVKKTPYDHMELRQILPPQAFMTESPAPSRKAMKHTRYTRIAWHIPEKTHPEILKMRSKMLIGTHSVWRGCSPLNAKAGMKGY